ncbi:MAG: V-type ATP synthase subunit E family protein [Candidatus Omnitrophota bacterium]
MAEDIKGLIERINQEGIIAAENKAKEIQNQAIAKAQDIIKKAQLKKEELLNQAKEEILKNAQKEKDLLGQAGRDMLLVLRQEINLMLERLINREIKDTLTPENLFKILSNIIKDSLVHEKGQIIISLNKKDLDALENGFLDKLKEEIKKRIILKSVDEIHAGFIISFDRGKSQFDFSDKALAEYIATFLKPKLKDILI